MLGRERPDALLPTLGGQTALNIAMALSDRGVLDELGVELIGANAEAIATAEDRERFKAAMIGLASSPIGEILIEESIAGWKEFELEVMRDRADNCAVICSIENVDPMGVHTGDSITVAPAQTLSDVEYQACLLYTSDAADE